MISGRRLTEYEVDALTSAHEIIGYRGDGLCSRLVCAFNVARLGNVLGKSATFIWENADIYGTSKHAYREPLSQFIQSEYLSDGWNVLDSPLQQEVNFSYAGMVLLPGEKPADVFMELREIALHAFTWADGLPLQDKIDWQPGSIGIHIRQGDAASIRWLGGRYWPFSFWDALVKRVIEVDGALGQSIYVASDSSAVLERLNELHANRITSRLRWSELPEGKLEQDLIDLLKIGGVSQLIGLRGSRYGFVASLFAGTPMMPAGEYMGIEAFLSDLRQTIFSAYVDDISAALAGPLGSEDRQRIEANLKSMHRFLNVKTRR